MKSTTIFTWVSIVFCLSLVVFNFVKGSEFTNVELASKMVIVSTSLYMVWFWVVKSPFALKKVREILKDED